MFPAHADDLANHYWIARIYAQYVVPVVALIAKVNQHEETNMLLTELLSDPKRAPMNAGKKIPVSVGLHLS